MRRIAPIWSATLLLSPELAGCSHSPSQNVMGSFFPSWLLCVLIGICLAIVCQIILRGIGAAEHVLVPMLTYPAVALAATFLAWLIWFSN